MCQQLGHKSLNKSTRYQQQLIDTTKILITNMCQLGNKFVNNLDTNLSTNLPDINNSFLTQHKY